jgi:hypothetical protein
MKWALLVAASTFACVPGLVTIIAGFGAPPNTGAWFGGIATSVGVLTVLLAMMRSAEISRVSSRRITHWSLALLGASLLALFVYVVLFDWCVVSHPAYGAIVYPLWATGDLAKLISHAGGRWEALDRYGTAGIDAAISTSSSIVWALTISSLIVCYSGLVMCMTAAFALPAARVERRSSPSRPDRSHRRETHKPEPNIEAGESRR